MWTEEIELLKLVQLSTPRSLGERAGQENVTLTSAQMPSHSHGVTCSSTRGNDPDPAGNILAGDPDDPYKPAGTDSMSPAMIQDTGGGQQHPNLQPFCCVNYIIALVGIYPSRN